MESTIEKKYENKYEYKYENKGEKSGGLYPVAKCPECRRTIFYSGNPKDKNSLFLKIAGDDYRGRAVLCPRCKLMLAVEERA